MLPYKLVFRSSACIWLCFWLAGCASVSEPVVQKPATVPTLESQAKTAAGNVYKIGPGNKLAVKFYYTPELNEEVVVRPDGRISLQLIQDVQAAGTTPEELANLLERRYASELKTPEIAVIVDSANQKVYIDGEVGDPGALDLDGPATVLQAVASAGGFTERARRDSIVLIRRQVAGEPLVLPLNMDLVYNGADISQDVMLTNFDIVYVPRSTIANINVWVDQYIRQNIPGPFIPLVGN